MGIPSEDNPAGHEYAVLGVALLCIGAFLLYCYFDRSGRPKPFVYRLLPGA